MLPAKPGGTCVGDLGLGLAEPCHHLFFVFSPPLPTTSTPHLPSNPAPNNLMGSTKYSSGLFVFERFVSAWAPGTAVQRELPSSGKGLKPATYILFMFC